MDLHQLDAFAARSVDVTLAEFHRHQHLPVSRPVRPQYRRRHAAVAMGTTLGVAVPAVTTVVIAVVR
ncbi:hypothetical protein FHE66_07270 [Georgenia sp. 311]|uniref:Uncharacterized protein n=1 Tax=Georgenia wutianyii TaxID=2585135 RepID=A0ABX5VR50_9MICO|nr:MULTISPECIES: hypothetical protein [Georgenia]QDB80548.1 hypothetical protein FE251_15100 [Georgenia wutianyii]TNC18241.1 hypothetical protein FHE66_07270 [Georgenia sp. 311]